MLHDNWEEDDQGCCHDSVAGDDDDDDVLDVVVVAWNFSSWRMMEAVEEVDWCCFLISWVSS